LELTRIFNTFHDDLGDKFTSNRTVTQNLTNSIIPPTVLAEADKQENRVALAYLHKQQERQLRENKARSRARLPVTFATSPIKAATATPVPVTPTTELAALQEDDMSELPFNEQNYAKVQKMYKALVDNYNKLHTSRIELRDSNYKMLNDLKDAEKQAKKLRAEREILQKERNELMKEKKTAQWGGQKSTSTDLIELNELREKVKTHRQELVTARKEVQSLRQKIETMEEAAELQEENRGTHQDSEVNDLKKKLANLGKEKKELVEKLTQCLDAMKKTGETAKFEQAEGVIIEVKKWMTEVAFNTTKFMFKKAEVKTKMTACYDAIKERIGLSEEGGDSYLSKEEFVRIYSPAGIKIFNDVRQYCQTKLMKAVFGKLTKIFVLNTLMDANLCLQSGQQTMMVRFLQCNK
jgi:DNA repair exonuclease SbcCD ATPase subunit